ncbi:MAG: hypothetical protein KBG15_17225, partial [Kofleriaceae bacterium]|nr:hypothetical protein [Kofleriaceae bacterium]
MKKARPSASKKLGIARADNVGAALVQSNAHNLAEGPHADRATEPRADPVRSRKVALRGLLIEALQTALASAHAAYRAAIEGATHAEAKAENSKDTRGLEQSYVARGQAQRVAELETGLATVTTMSVAPHPTGPVRIGSLAVVRDQQDGRTATYWMAPAGGGTTLLDRTATDARELIVLTPQSPLGRALLTRAVGDEITLGEGPT